MEIAPLGDSALIVRIRNQFEDAPEQTLNEVLRALRRIEDARIPGVIELAPAYTTIAVFLDPLRVMDDAARVDHVIESLPQKTTEAFLRGGRRKQRDKGTRLIEIPVCYEAEFALDLEQVSRQAQIDPTEIIDLHRAAEYRVSFIGF